MEGFGEFDGLEVQRGAFLALGGEAFLGDKGFGVKHIGLLVLELLAVGQEYLGMKVRSDVHQFGPLGVGNEKHGRVVALREAEALHIESLGGVVPVQDGVHATRIQFLYADNIALVLVHEVVRGGVIRAVRKNCKDLVLAGELAKVLSAAVFVEALDIGIVPDVLALKGGDALGLEGDARYGVLGYKVSAGSAALDGKVGEIPFQLALLEALLGTEAYAYGLRLAVMVHREPEYL